MSAELLVVCLGMGLGMGLVLHLTPFASLSTVSLTAPFPHESAYLDFNLFMFNLLGFTFGCAAFAIPLSRVPRGKLAASSALIFAVHMAVAALYVVHSLLPSVATWMPAHAVASTLAGVSCSLAFAFWGNWLTLSLSVSEGNLALAGALFVAALTKSLPIEGLVAGCLTGLASAAGSFLCLWNLSKDKVLLVGREEPRDIASMPKVTLLMFLGSGFTMTCLLAMMTRSGVEFEAPSAITFLAVASALLLSHRSTAAQRWLTLGRYARLASFVVTLGALGFLVFFETLPSLAATLAALAWFLQVTSLMGSVVDLVSKERCGFLASWASYCLLCGIGVLLGLALMLAAQSLPLDLTSVLGSAAALLATGTAVTLPGALNSTREFHRGSFVDGETPGQRMARRERYLEDTYELTAREMEVVRCLARGLSYRMVSVDLGISENTVKVHAKNIYAKCGVHARGELIALLDD